MQNALTCFKYTLFTNAENDSVYVQPEHLPRNGKDVIGLLLTPADLLQWLWTLVGTDSLAPKSQSVNQLKTKKLCVKTVFICFYHIKHSYRAGYL